MDIEFFKHSINQDDYDNLRQVLDSVFLSSGERTEEFESLFAGYLKLKHCIGTASWTAGAFLTLKAWGIGPGDEVIVPAMTFIASANVVLHCGAKPAIVDVSPDTGLIDTGKIEEAITPRTKAIIPVHLYGQMADMKSIRAIADKYSLKILEDAAHCIEGEREGIKPGQLGDAAVFSFYATKNITSGEGGAIVINNSELAEKLRILRLHGMDKSAASRHTGKYTHWDMLELGYKANMFDMQAALLIGQLERIEGLLARRNKIWLEYEKAFKGKINYPKTLPNIKHARHLFTIGVKPQGRDKVLSRLQENHIGVAVNYRAIHLLKYYKEKFGYERGTFPNAEKIGDSTISLPFYPALKADEIKYIIDMVLKAVESK